MKRLFAALLTAALVACGPPVGSGPAAPQRVNPSTVTTAEGCVVSVFLFNGARVIVSPNCHVGGH